MKSFLRRLFVSGSLLLLSLAPPLIATASAQALAETNILIGRGSIWKYLDNGTDQGTSWVSNSFDDISWASGPAQLGYGDSPRDEATMISFGPNQNNKYITYYFRRAFSVTNAVAYTNLSMWMLRDDAGIVYLNGVEIFRSSNMPSGAVNYLTLATSVGENTIDTTNFPTSGLLIEGTNLLAVEIHQQAVTSSDISFDFELTGIRASDTNAKPIITITAPANGTTFGTPAGFTVGVSALDPDGTVTNVAFYVNGVKAGDDPTSPFSFTTNNVPAGAYALTAVATDNVGQSTTSSVVNVTVSTNVAPPVLFSKSPVPGNVTSLTNITVTFSKAVQGVDAGDLLINGVVATSVSGSGSNYTFTFPQPAFGTVTVRWISTHGIADMLTPPHAFDTNSAGANWNYQLLDSVPPTVTSINPLPGSAVSALTSISVTFSELVTGVGAADLLINSSAAAGLTGSGAGPYVFSFAQPALGVVNVAWAGGHGIADLSGNPFSPTPWSYTLDTNIVPIVISEIMFHPSSENILEEYIELYNKNASAQSLNGWKLKSAVDFNFTNVSIPANGYLVIAANRAAFTSKDRKSVV